LPTPTISNRLLSRTSFNHGRSPLVNVIDPRNEGREHSQPGVQGLSPWPPEARFFFLKIL